MSSRDINDNKAPLEGDREELDARENEGPQVEVLNLRDEIPKTLLKVLKERDMGQEVVKTWDKYNSLRASQLERQRKLVLEIDEFMDPIYKPPQEWMSKLHMPVSMTICKTFHARMFSALMGPLPQVRARKEANVERAELVEDLMQYTIKDWANNHEGIDNAMDDFVWEWVTQGRGILKMRWDKQFTRFVDVEERVIPGPVTTDAKGNLSIQGEEIVEDLVQKDMTTFEGPIWEHVPQEDVLIVGGNGDPDRADFVGHQIYMTPHELWTLADRKLFDRAAVEAVIESGHNMRSAESTNQIKSDKASRSGESNPDDQEMIDRYQILECYLKVDLKKSGIYSDVVIWVHKQTSEILRATYLWRVMQTGQKPFAVADFHRRKGQQSGVGLIELTYTLAKEIDAMHNMRIDYGILSTTPFGFYRASSSLDRERLTLTPGELIPVDNPQIDVNFPVLGNRSIFPAQEEEALFSYISRVTSMSDLNFGVLGAQGAARTATGARAVISESTNNLDIFVKRLNRAYKKALRYTFSMLKVRVRDGFEFRLLGKDGNQYFRQIETRRSIQGMYDFMLEPSSSATNKQIQIENATQIMNLVNNPIFLQLGIVNTSNLYEAAKNFLEKHDIKDWSRYVTKPPAHQRVFTPEELGNRLLAGIDVPLTPEQDLAGFVNWVDTVILGDEDILGQFSEPQIAVLAGKKQQAADMLQALKAVEAQAANRRQMQVNAAESLDQTTAAPSLGQEAQ